MAEPARAPDPRTPPPPRDPKRGDHRVSGAPDKPPMIPWNPRRFLLILAGLFLLNYLFVAIFAPPPERIRVPYSPFFLEQVRDGNVREVSSQGNTIKGEFRREKSFEGDRAGRFDTEVPTFANDRELSELLEERRVRVTAEPPASARCSRRCCSASAPRSCWWCFSSGCYAAPQGVVVAPEGCSASSAARGHNASRPPSKT